jgi:hypothetical protein
MRKATSGSFLLRPELLPRTLQIPPLGGHPVLSYMTRLAFSHERTLTSKLMVLHGTHKKGQIAPAFFRQRILFWIKIIFLSRPLLL